MSNRIQCLQHVPFEGPGSMAEDFHQRGWPMEFTHWYLGDSAPSLNSFDWLVVMGGPMNVDDDALYPWLETEKALIREAIDGGKMVLGVCLGAQLIARALGATVTAMPRREIGWFPVRRQEGAEASVLGPALPSQFDAFHWHGDSFELPTGARLLASSDACANQIFSLGSNVFGFQCHLETTPKLAQALIENSGDDLDGSHWVQSAEEISAYPERFAPMNRVMTGVIDAIVAGQR